MKKRTLILRGILGIIGVFIFLSLMFSVVFFLTSYIYTHTTWNPSAYSRQLINSLLGLVLILLVGAGLSEIIKAKGWGHNGGILNPILEALERIAKGDYSVRVDNTFGKRENEIFGGLVESVNRVALELNQAEAMRQEFISNVSHEIQSPLTSIRGFAAALKNEALSQNERAHYLGIIESESTRLSRITEDLLKMSALESEHIPFDPKTYRLDKQIRRLILTSEPQWTGKKIDMDVALEEIEITADEDHLSQVWNNLIHNSIKFTPVGGRIYVDLHRQGEVIEFIITDTGIGIREADQERVFERFYKADPSRTQSSGGSGLGLAIVKKIVEIHKGSIRVQSRVGVGSVFTVRLPVR